MHEDEALQALHDLMAEGLLDVFYRMECLERRRLCKSDTLAVESVPMERLPPLNTQAEVNEAIRQVRKRLTALENSER